MDHAKYIQERVEEAISTMRSVCDDAENTLRMYSADPMSQPQAVMHDFMWGVANAFSSIQAAHNYIGRNVKFREVT